MNNRYELKQQRLQTFLAFVLIMPVFIDIAYVTLNAIGIGSYASVVTAVFYIVVLIMIILKCRFTVKDLSVLALIYLVFIINYFIFEETREYMVSKGMIIVYIFFLPYCVIGFRHIRKWELFAQKLYHFSGIAIVLSLVMLVLLPYEKYLVYMDFSYALLPAICVSYYEFARNRNSNRLQKVKPLVLFLISTIEILVFGARAPLLFVVLYIALYEISRKDMNLTKKIGVFSAFVAAALLISFSFEFLMREMANNSIFSNSYIVRSYLRGALFESDTRNVIWDNCIMRIKTMGLSIGGFFGDRSYCGSAYPHNFFLEVLMSWGWIIGIPIIVLFIRMVAKGLIKKGMGREIVLLVLCSVLLRFLLSGTYLSEGKFWVAVFTCIAVGKSKNITV